MVYRIFVEKKEGLAHEATSLCNDLKKILLIPGIERVRILNQYDVENIEADLFEYCKTTVFSEPQLDIVTEEVDTDATASFAVEFLPGQFDQRADSAAQCIQLISQKERPTIRTAKVYLLYGTLSDSDIATVKNMLSTRWKAARHLLTNRKHWQQNMKFPQKLKLSAVFANILRQNWKILHPVRVWLWIKTTLHSVSSILKARIVTRLLQKSK